MGSHSFDTKLKPVARSDGAVETAPGAAPPVLDLALTDFSGIVGDIYQCVLDPALWPGAVDRIRAAIGAKAAWIGVHYPSRVRSVYEVEVGTDPAMQQLLRETYVPMSPFISMRYHVKPGAVVSVDDVVDYDEFASGRFFKEWAGPQGLADFIMGVTTVEAESYTWMGLCLPQRADAAQKRLVAEFLPHVRRALRISDLMDQRAAEAADLTATMGGLATGVMMVDARFGVTGVNPAAERLTREAGTLHVAHGRLVCPAGDAGAELAAAVAASRDRRLDQAGASILFSDSYGGIGLLAHVLPLTRPRRHHLDEPVAAIFLTRPGAVVRTPLRAFVKRFELTPSETRVMLGLMDGKSPRAITQAQGVAMPTVRTHLQRLYAKTGTTGQPDLVRLVASLSGLNETSAADAGEAGA